MTSLWLRDHRPEPASSPRPGEQYDHVVVGAGLTGLVTALLLARAGGSTAVLEARHSGAVATGNTTGKLSLLQGTRASAIAARHGREMLRAYVDANREGQSWLLRYCQDHGLHVDRESAFTIATERGDTGAVDAEFRACRAAGLPVRKATPTELPFRTADAVELPEQAQLDPILLLTTLISDLREHGGELYSGTRVRDVRPKATLGGRGPLRVCLDDDTTLEAGSVVLATGTPLLDRGGFFGRLHARRSYSVAFELSEPVPRSMYLRAGDPTVSLRYAWRDRQRVLLVGGFGHDVGRAGSEQAHVDSLVDWATTHFPSAVPRERWSAQDYDSIDRLPYVGPILPGEDRILVATGFAKWGLTNGTAAALAMAGRLLGGNQPWARPLRTWRPSELTSLPSAASLNAAVSYRMASGWTRLAVRNLRRTERKPCPVRPVCTHLGGVLEWNDTESSWDCPLHGSRFAADGRVLEGPATRPLHPKPLHPKRPPDAVPRSARPE